MKFPFVISAFLAIFLLSTIAMATDSSIQVGSAVTPSTIVPGNDGYIQLTITNVGTVAPDRVEVKLNSLDSPLIARTTFPLGGIGALDIGKSLSTTFRFSVPSSASSGFYNAVFTVSACQTSSGSCKDSTVSTIITIQTPSALQLSSVAPTNLKIGKSAVVNFTLNNIGQTALNNIVLSWLSDSNLILPLGSSNEIFIQSISGGEKKVISSDLIVKQGATPGVNPLTVKITYYDPAGTKQTVNSTVGLTISGDVEFVVTLESTKNLYYGKVGTATISLSNIGTVAAEYLTAKAWSDFGSKEVYLGKLDPDESDTVELTQYLAKAKEPYIAYLNLSYKDSYGNVYSIQKTLQLTPTTAPLELPTTWIFVLIVVAVGGIWWVKRRKK